MISNFIWIFFLILLSVSFAAPQVCDQTGRSRANSDLSHLGPIEGLNFTIKGTVVFVIDGDTLTVLAEDGIPHSVKFFGADAPELKQAWGQESADQLTSMVSGKQVVVDVRRSGDKGSYYGIIQLGGMDVGLAQIGNGFAWAYEPANCQYQFERRAEYIQTESKSRKARIGLWADPDPVPPWTYRGEVYSSPAIDTRSKPPNTYNKTDPRTRLGSPDVSGEGQPENRKYILGPRGGCYYVNDQHYRIYVADRTLCKK